jgi:hypothetical protein
MKQTLEKLKAMKLLGMANYLEGWLEVPPTQDVSASELSRSPEVLDAKGAHSPLGASP